MNPVEKAHDKSPQVLLVTDLDNTLYDFGQYFEAGLKRLIPVLMSLLAIDENEALLQVRAALSRTKNLENPFIVEHMPITESLSKNEARDLARTANIEFWEGAKSGLYAYPGVEPTLRHLRAIGVPVVAHTDAPIHQAIRRLRFLQLDGFFQGIVATSWFRKRQGPYPTALVVALPGFRSPPRRYKVTWRLSPTEAKPNRQVLKRIASTIGGRETQVLVVGDSVTRDVQPAIESGFIAAWAQYGIRDTSKEPLLQSVVPSRLSDLLVQPELPDGCSAIDTFADVVNLIPGQLPLPILI
ncbi:FMN phosphatase YigB, HAD superfamily [Actinopolymorpha cephalotaxi]|uniref:FMN phosphatase YigB, HAD superfamily n=1 Tax=Actinopolymorpha cephalotaxi TaxID=504797 RepID=A0A1I3C6Q6_9ACTN|nr:HAD family hydrolase [Actinopolymorpha cephalotaxi]NYH85420.1 phosphoglycolate phosphatase [Actinopolymorpha cephalotaxi]SFH69681.1 FMN phosphatase YigB, HAD superfamily [Actinopolymorpha cephalotaxi]